MIVHLASCLAFAPSIAHVPAVARAPSPSMISFLGLPPPDDNAVDLYMASTAVGLAVTATLAPLLFAKVAQDEGDEVCEIINTPAPTMHQSYDEEDKDWWICTGQELAENCREVFYDGEMVVACAY